MKKIRRALSVFLAVAVFVTQSATMAYSEPIAEIQTTSQSSDATAGNDETESTIQGSGGESDESAQPGDISTESEGETGETEDEETGSEETVRDDAYYEALSLSIEEK